MTRWGLPRISRGSSRIGSLLLVAVGLAVPALAARGARLAAGRSYRAITKIDPPKNPASAGVSWREAILWTVLSGALGGLARLVARRWLSSTSLPAEGDDLHARAEAAK